MNRIYLTTLLFVSIFVAASAQPMKQGVTVYQTSKEGGDKISLKQHLSFTALPQPKESEAAIIVDDAKSFQQFVGIGGAFTDAAAETFSKLSASKQEEVIDAYFDPVKGIGYSLGRIPIHSSDFSSDSYTYVEDGDISLKSFSIKHDYAFKIPLIKRAMAKAGGRYTFFVSPWSPPAWMKSNNDMLHGGVLLPKFYQAWANYYIKTIQAYEKEGIPIWGLTVQNEAMAVQTWESCTYTAEQERDFVKKYLGPTLYKAKMGAKKLMIWDHNRGLLYQRAKVVYDDPEAAKYVWGAAYHWYSGDHFDNVRLTHDAYPAKNLLFTEGCFYPFDYARIGEWQWGELYATSMINDFNSWATGWTDWNLILNEKGGPNHVGNFCYAPIIVDTQSGDVHFMNSFYYIGHFSKFIKPGAKRILCSSVSDALMATAFKNPDGEVVVVVLNKGDMSQECLLWLNAKAASYSMPAHSIITMVVSK